MVQTRIRVVLLILTMAVLFNIERLDFDTENIVNIDTFVYVLATANVVFIVGLSKKIHLPVYVIIAATGLFYIIGKEFFSISPLFEDAYLYLTIAEVALLALATTAAYAVAHPLNMFEESIESLDNLILGESLPTVQQSTKHVYREMYRSRHDQQPLSIIVARPSSSTIKHLSKQFIEDIERQAMNGRFVQLISSPLNQQIRPTDVILSDPDNRGIIILCPNTDAKDADNLADLIQLTADRDLKINLACGVATFPEKGFTFEELIRSAEAHIRFQSRTITFEEQIEALKEQKA